MSDLPAPAPTSAAASQARDQGVLVSILSIAVIAVSALLLRWLTVPTEVTTSLATASGALVPLIALRRQDRKKAKAQRVHELVSGSFERPAIYVVIIAAGALVMIEYVSYLVVGFLAGIGLGAAADQGTITEDEISGAADSDVLTGLSALVALLVMGVACLAVGAYVGHRVVGREIVWAVAAVVLSQTASLVTDLVVSALMDVPITSYVPYVIFPLALSLPVLIGALRGRKTRALFRASRLFRRLPEGDRAALLEMMEESQVAQRLDAGGAFARTE